MITILRHELPHYVKRASNIFHLNMHGGASIIQVAETVSYPRRGDQKPEYNIYLWAIEDTNIPVEKREFRYVQDGERLDWADADQIAWRHVASFTSVSGNIWQHIIETTGLVVTEALTGSRRPSLGRSQDAIEGAK